MKTDEIIRSMKAQMQPSDEVVDELLSLIAAEKASSDAEVVPVTRAKKKRRPVWYYGTAIAACLVILVSAFAFINTGDPDSDTGAIRDLFNSITGSDSVYQDSQAGTEYAEPDADSETGGYADSIISAEGAESAVAGDSLGLSEAEGIYTDADEIYDQDMKYTDAAVLTDADETAASAAKNSSRTYAEGSAASSDSNLITPGAASSGDISWTNELLNTSEIATLSVYGSTYTVDSTISSSEVGNEITSVTLNLPQTSTTGATTLHAAVCSVSNVSAVAMVALDVDGFDEALIYSNPNYSPSTLGELVSDLGINSNTSFSSSVTCQTSENGSQKYTTYNKKIDNDVWTYLLSDGSAGQAGYSSYNNGTTKLTFVSNSNPTGSQIQFGVSDNGYLYIVLSSGQSFTFHIGTANASGFISSVTGEA